MAGYLQKKYSDKAKLDYRLVRKPSYQQKKKFNRKNQIQTCLSNYEGTFFVNFK